MKSARARLRPPLAAILWPVLRPFRPFIERTRDGSELLPGITAVVAARDEAYTIGFCLRGLIGFADQIVCIDNGSEDETLQEMRTFRENYGDRVDADVVSMPGALLGDCREEGLRRARRQWHLRWDADMVAKTSGPESMLDLRARVLTDQRPRTIQLPRTNLVGDLRHAGRFGPVVDPGEPILVRFGRGIEYREFGRFDALRAPLHYAQRAEQGRHYFHLAGLKSDENLIHRFHYFTWREAVNRKGPALDPALHDLDDFKRVRNLELFGTNEPRSLKFRYQRQLSYHFVRYDESEYGAYPEVLGEELSRSDPRFEVVYRDGRPWIRMDRGDEEMRGYEPTAEDLAWSPEDFLRRFLSPEQCRMVGIEPGE
jgi:glycosyltransferase involved in cell wall biosynthesis